MVSNGFCSLSHHIIIIMVSCLSICSRYVASENSPNSGKFSVDPWVPSGPWPNLSLSVKKVCIDDALGLFNDIIYIQLHMGMSTNTNF